MILTVGLLPSQPDSENPLGPLIILITTETWTTVTSS